MKVETDDLAGVTVSLDVGDDLRKVPASHRDLITPEVREVFANPKTYFGKVRDKAPVPNMRKWFDRMVKKGLIQLYLEVGDPPEIRRAGFWLVDLTKAPVYPSIVGLPVPFDADLYPEPLAEFYRIVGFVDWMALMFGGKLESPDPPGATSFTLAEYWGDDPSVEYGTTHVIGGSACGDAMICTKDGRGGWWNHETGKVALMGSIADLLDWVFGELLADRFPERPESPRQ